MTTKIVLGTATPGGGFPLYGDKLAETINETDSALHVEARNTKGSTENIPLIEKGELDIALCTGEPFYEAIEGIGRPKAKLTIITAMYSTAGMFVVRGDSPAKTISDLKGKPVAFGTKGSGLTILSRYVMEGLGLDQQKDFQPIFLDKAGDGPVMVSDGTAAALWGGGVGWPGFATLAKAGGRFIPPSADEIAKVRAKFSFLKATTLPANSYEGQTQAIPSVGSWSYVLARPTLSDDIAYALAKAIHKGHAAFVKKLDQAVETTPANTAAAAPSPELIHPGVRKYLKELGL